MNLRELSAHLGVSQTTISRALNGYPEVSESTRLRVQDAADRLGYKPNTRAKSLATGRAYAIGHVIPIVSKHEVVNPIFGEFISGASETYTANGYELKLTVANSADEGDIYRELHAKGSVDGVMIHAPRHDDDRIALLDQIGLPYVVHGRVSSAQTPYSWVDVNNRRAFAHATDYLIGLGHSRIGLINGLVMMDFAYNRLNGYRDALENAGIAFDQDIVHSSSLTESYGHASARSLLSQSQPVTAIIVSSYVVAIGVRRAIEEFGLKIGTDVSVIIHDDVLSYFDNNQEVPTFTATRSSVRDAGRIAAQVLLDVVGDPARAPITRLLEAELAVGHSTGPCPKSG